jgi:hypothetical protein
MRTSDLLIHAIKQFKLDSPKSSIDSGYAFQLISIGTYRFELDANIRQSNRWFAPTNQDLHFRLLPKRISVNLLLNFNPVFSHPRSIDDLSRSKWLSIQIDPTASIIELKQLVSELFPVNWNCCLISFRGLQLADHHLLFSVAIGNNDHLTIDHI